VTDGTVTVGTSTVGTVTVGRDGTGSDGTGSAGTVGSCGVATDASSLGDPEAGGLGAEGAGDGDDEDGFGSGACAGRTGVGADRLVVGPAGCATTRPLPCGRPTWVGFAAVRGSDVCTAARWRYAAAASSAGSTTVGLEGLCSAFTEGNGDGAKPRKTITVNRITAPPAAEAQSLTSSRRDAWTLMITLSG
jgi:hypothetical protein